MDVKTAFLKGDLENDIYMGQPEGYIDKDHPELVCKLNKIKYGLEQAASCWNLATDKFLKSSRYTYSTANPCIYYKIELRDGRECLMILAVYVNDTILASNDDEMLKSEKARLSARFV